MKDVRIAGDFVPDVPTILSFRALPLRRKSKRVRPTTPIFLSEPDSEASGLLARPDLAVQLSSLRIIDSGDWLHAISTLGGASNPMHVLEHG